VNPDIQKMIGKWWFYLLAVIFLIVPVAVLLISDDSALVFAFGFVNIGIALVYNGFGWIRWMLPEIKSRKWLGVGFIVMGFFMMTFLWVYNNMELLPWALMGAAVIEAYETMAFFMVYFLYVKHHDNKLNEKYEGIVTHATDAIILMEGPLITDCNPQAEKLFAMTKEEIIGHSPYEFSPVYQENGKLSKDYARELYEIALSGRITNFDWIHKNKHGDLIRVETSMFIINELQTAAIMRDISYKKDYEEKINFYRYYDILTELPKRELFVDRLNIYLEEKRDNVALIAFNIDKFKEINDNLGHDVGDILLVYIARKIESIFRKETTVTRMGGDEFIVLLDSLPNRNSIYIPMERLESIFREPIEIMGNTLNVTACFGVAFPENKDTTANELLNNVDFALNRAKQNGRAQREFFSNYARDAFLERVKIEQDMCKGIENGEFTTFYQPVVDPNTERIKGAEALMRWIMPDGKIIYPGVFIPIAEETGMIIEMGKQILMEACWYCKSLLDQNPDFVINVNFSALQLKDKSIVNVIQNALDKTELTARHLQVELTETLLIENEKYVGEVLKKIRKLGVRVALDDFGTGYSSLSYLSNMNVDTIKIDREFVIRYSQDKKTGILLRNIVRLVKDLGYTIVVEGVEEYDQVQFLKELGCNYIQGYYYYRPMDEGAMDRLMK
jgi:diguanylate cyclase (GGDEF)-like protein/PAS domain S-box-containing protein